MTGPDRLLRLEVDEPRWAEWVSGRPEATPFHHPRWARMLARTYGYRAFALAVEGDDRELAAGAPFMEVRTLSRRRRWISLPFTDECPPLAVDGDAAQRLARALAIATDRAGAPDVEVRGPVGGLGWRVSAHAVAHDLALEPDFERVRTRFSRSQVIRNVKRARREGAEVRAAASEEDLDAFYALHSRTRRRQGVPVQPRRFFAALWREVLEPGLGTVLLADVPGRRAVAGAVFLHWNGTTVYKFGASDADAWPHRPNHAIFWRAIEDACARGDRRLDFGRTDLGNDGLRTFKRAWGGVERPLAYATLEAGAGAEGLASRTLSAAIRRGPRWLGPAVGTALYRYAAAR